MPGSAARLANWIPDPTPEFGSSPTPFIVLMLAGFAIGAFGSLIRSRTMTALGIGMIFLATFLLPLATNVLRS